MNSKIVTRVILILILSTTLYAKAQKINSIYIDSVFDSNYKLHKFSGKVLIAKNGKIVFDKSYGFANYETKEPFSDDSRFQIASVSKQFTAYALLFLKQQGKLKLDDLVVKYLPDFPFSGITIRHLLTHASGLPDSEKTMWKDYDTSMANGNNQMLKMLESGKYPLQFQPGEKLNYCDIGFCVLATLVEKVSGERFDVFMQKNLFAPAKMNNTTAELYTDIRKINPSNLSVGYEYDSVTNKYLPADLIPKNSFVQWLGGFYGDGSVVSTTHDLLKWDKTLYNYKTITKESVELSITPVKLNNGENGQIRGGNYGLGWSLFFHPELGKVITHGGSHPGFISKFTRFPDKKITVIILSNILGDSFWKYTNITNHWFLKTTKSNKK